MGTVTIYLVLVAVTSIYIGTTLAASTDTCLSRSYGQSSIVCVCNEFYCDTIPRVEKVNIPHYKKYTSSQIGLRFHEEFGKFSESTTKLEDTIEINPNETYQTIHGFGGTFTDSAGLNIKSLNEDLVEKLLRSYYSSEGIEYSMGRVPMAATDFSIRPYTYDDVIKEDKYLKQFKLHEEDFKYKIPLIQRANELTNKRLQLIATPWTAPPWMKTNDNYAYQGLLKEQYYQIFADYYIKFFDEYAKNDILFWGLTTGNEPFDGILPLPYFSLPTTGWTHKNSAKWVANNLGPSIRNSRYNNTKIIIHDDQRLFLPLLEQFYNNEEALKYVDGVAVHWYLDMLTPPYFLNYAKTPKKELFLIPTEASAGFLMLLPVALGSWERAESYIESIFTNLKYGAIGWIDFNLALNLDGGPVYTQFAADSTIIVNKIAGEFYKQPTYYAMGHFSKFLPRGSVRITSSSNFNKDLNGINFMAFKRPDHGKVLIIFNKRNSDAIIKIKDSKRGEFQTIIDKKSICTILYW